MQLTTRFLQRLLCFCLIASIPASTLGAENTYQGVLIKPIDNKLRIEINGEFFTEYHYQDVSRPFFYPVMGPKGLPMTRNWPMAEGAGEEHDHPHHKSFWYAHGEINGHDFWSESSSAGTTHHVAFLRISSGAKKGIIKTLNHLIAKDGTIVGSDVRTMTIHNRPDEERIVDFDIEVRASHGQSRVFVPLSSGYDSGAICCALNQENVKYTTVTIGNTEDRRVLDDRIKINPSDETKLLYLESFTYYRVLFPSSTNYVNSEKS